MKKFTVFILTVFLSLASSFCVLADNKATDSVASASSVASFPSSNSGISLFEIDPSDLIKLENMVQSIQEYVGDFWSYMNPIFIISDFYIHFWHTFFTVGFSDTSPVVFNEDNSSVISHIQERITNMYNDHNMTPPASGNQFEVRFDYKAQFNFASYNKDNGQITFTTRSYYCNFAGQLYLTYNSIVTYLKAYLDMFDSWYRPNGSLASQWYFEVYNSDTGEKESTNLAGVLYNISWYLGNMFEMNTWSADTELDGPISDLNDKFNEMDDAENNIWNSVSSAFDGFAPDSSDITELSAIGWVSNYLQQVFVSLGAFNIPIMVALMLGVCMQFIGYFKYKY